MSEEAAEMELFIQHQMEQEQQDQYDLKLFHEHQQHEKTIIESQSYFESRDQ
jgi:hypothetical protein